MDKNIIQQGSVAKWHISIDRVGFDMDSDDFSVTLSCGIYPVKEQVVTKSQMGQDDDGYYFTFDSLSVLGKITATCEYSVTDTDGRERKIVDRQIIGFVVNHACPQFQCCCTCSSDNNVTYEAAGRDCNIYYGSGDVYTDAGQVRLASKVAGDYDVVVKADGDHVFFVIPSSMTIASASMSNFDFPLDAPISVSVDGERYKSYKSANTYDAGTYTITLD